MVQIQTGRVVDGKVVVDTEVPLEEGAVVTVVSGDPEETFEIPDELRSHLRASIEELDRGPGVPAEEVLAELARG